MYSDLWYVIDDARLIDSGHHEHPDEYRPLDFKGSYDNSHFKKVELNNCNLYQSYYSLMHSHNEILVAVFYYIVFI